MGNRPVGVCSGAAVWNYTLNIDEERSWMLYSGYREFAGLAIRDGRFGLVLLAWLTKTTASFPYWNDLLAVAFLLLFAVGLCYAFRQEGRAEMLVLCGAVLFLTFPSHHYMLAFSYMMPSIALCCTFVLAAAALVDGWLSGEAAFCPWRFLAAALLVTLSMATYQSLAVVFLLLVALLQLRRIEAGMPFRKLLLLVLKCAAVLASSYLAYWLANQALARVYFTRSLTESRLRWAELPVGKVLRQVWVYITEVLSGKRIEGGVGLGVSFWVAVACGLYRAIRKRKLDVFFFLPPVLVLVTFAMNIALGNDQPVRALQAVPVLLFGLWLYMALCLKEFTFPGMRHIALALCLVLTVLQVQADNRLAYSAVYRHEREREVIHRIAERIDDMEQSRTWEKPVVFLGDYPIEPNGRQLLQAETISGTVLDWDGEAHQRRKQLYFTYLGHPYPLPTAKMLRQARKQAADMPSWPATDSVRETEGFFIVKFGESW